jgi:inorganic triphosphatase YgiF
MPTEIELKLALDLRDVPLLRKSPTLNRVGLGKATRKRIVTTYYDTPSLSLLHNAVALRVRKVGHDHVQSIKVDRANGSYPAERAEFENPIPSDRPDLQCIEDRSIRRLVEGSRRGKRLRPVFSTNVMRETRLLKFAGNEIECAIDRGFVAGRGKKAPICELELELRSGEAASLIQLARRLNANIPLRIEPKSKATRGYALVTGAQLAAPKAKPIQLDAAMSAWNCLNTIIDACTAHVVAAADYAFKSEDPEGVHQLRVAIRRMRAVLLDHSELCG